MMLTLAQALARSMPRRAAYAYTRHSDGTTGLVEVRCLTPLRPGLVTRGSLITAPLYRYELLTNGRPQVGGSYREVASWVARLGTLDWQPSYDGTPVQATETAESRPLEG